MNWKLMLATGGSLALAGCGLSETSLRDAAPSERCGEVMRQAMPKAEIEITAAKADGDASQDLNTIRATVEGTAKSQKPGPVAMECVFHNGVLVSIRWLGGQEAAK
jgi:hypothetical protein